MSFLNSLLSHLSQKKTTPSIEVVANRFIRVFVDHGVEVPQIPRLLPSIKLSDLRDSTTLLAALNPEILDQVATLFGIRVEWLEGVDDEIYGHLGCYKRPALLLEHLKTLLVNDVDKYSHPLRVLCTTKNIDSRSVYPLRLAPVLLEKIADFGDESIYRYHVYRDGFSWSYYPNRIELKAIARLVYHRLGVPVSLYEIDDLEMEQVLEGRLIPGHRLSGCLLSDPSLEDYALDTSESRKAKEVAELPEVLRYIEEQDLHEFSFDRSSPDKAREVETKGQNDSQDDWCEAARAIADELDLIDANCGAHDSKSNIADRVATEMRKRKIFGPRGPLSANTVLREALGGKKWKQKR